MIAFIFVLPLIAALLCMALNRIVSTRWLGIGAAGILLLAAGMLLLASSPAPLSIQAWSLSGEQPVLLTLAFDDMSRPFALLALGGGGLALLALALALPSDLRGFGGLLAALLLVVLTVVTGMANQKPVLLPFAWALTALLSFVALRASGAGAAESTLPVGLLAGLAGVLLLVGATLAPDIAALGLAGLICWTLVGLLALGAPPFHAVFDEPAEAPAALVGTLLPLGLPLLGGYTLLHFAATQWAAAPPAWRMAWALLGLLAVLACAAGATATTRVRRLIGWQFSAQLGLVLMSIGLGADRLSLAIAAGLLINAILATLACYLAMIILERRAGTDDLEAIGAHGPLLLPGLAFLYAAASAIGCPGTWGWWAHSALFEHARSTAPWLIAPLLASGVLRALVYVAPLAAFWRAAEARPPAARRGWPTLAAWLCPALAALPLLAWGVAPELAWDGWLVGFQPAGAAPAPPGTLVRAGSGLAALVLIGLPLLVTRGRPRWAPVDQEVRNTALLIPQALGYSLRGLSGLGAPGGLFRAIWANLLRFSRAAAWLLSLFEQRYYLAGLMIAVIIVIMLMI
jgi:formate hydrogenlyase subunit 3/multisubunit Na+/H+ antiporter MnhD subunit